MFQYLLARLFQFRHRKDDLNVEGTRTEEVERRDDSGFDDDDWTNQLNYLR